MIFNTTSIIASLSLVAKFFGAGSDEEKLPLFGVDADEESFPTASPLVISSFSPTGTCDLECKTDYGKSASQHSHSVVHVTLPFLCPYNFNVPRSHL